MNMGDRWRELASLLPAGIVLYWARRARAAAAHSDLHCTEAFAAKRSAFTRRSVNDLLVITDFDATLTAGDSPQCHDVLGKSPRMPRSVRDAFKPLLDFSVPLPESISGVRWWERANEILVASGEPRREQLAQMVRESEVAARPGALRMLERLSAHDVPVLVVSAGCSNVIEAFLEARGLLRPNVRVCSNRLVWNVAGDGAVCAATPAPPVTSRSKDQTHARNAAWLAAHAHRRSLLVLGDRCTDLHVAAGVPHDTRLGFGFFNSPGDGDSDAEGVDSYLAAGYDAVVTGSQAPCDLLTELIEEMAS